MKSKILIFVALFTTTITFSQMNPSGSFINTFMYEAKPGMVDQFEEAVAKKTKMFNGTENPMLTYKVITGQNSGDYRRYNLNQSAEDYNQDYSKENDYWTKNVMPYGEVVYSQKRWERFSWGDQGDQNRTPYKFVQETYYNVKPGSVESFNVFQSRIGQVFAKSRPNQGRAIARLRSGGNNYVFIVFRAFDQFGESGQVDNMEDEYNEMFGYNQYERDFEAFISGLDYFGVSAIERYLLEFVPELSTKMGNQ